MITVGSRDIGYHQTKARCVAIDALSTLVVVSTPTVHHLERACGPRRATRHSRIRVSSTSCRTHFLRQHCRE